jgi:hypothetical protein
VESADGDHAGPQRLALAADDALDGLDDLRADIDRVLAGMRGGAMRADAVDGDVDAVGRAVLDALGRAHLAGREIGIDVECEA